MTPEVQAVIAAARVVVARVTAAPDTWLHDDTRALIAAVSALDAAGEPGHGRTRHGQVCCAFGIDGRPPRGMTKCGGPASCIPCAEDRDRIHAAPGADEQTAGGVR